MATSTRKTPAKRSIPSVPETTCDTECLADHEISYHQFLTGSLDQARNRVNELENAAQTWMEHLATTYQLVEGDQVHKSGLIQRGG